MSMYVLRIPNGTLERGVAVVAVARGGRGGTSHVAAIVPSAEGLMVCVENSPLSSAEADEIGRNLLSSLSRKVPARSMEFELDGPGQLSPEEAA